MNASRQKSKLSRTNSASNQSARPISKKRLWLFRLTALLLPVLLLCVLEITLRLGGYGYDTRFFRRLRIGNEDYYVPNDNFALRFFPKETVRNPNALRMKAHKPPGTFRIFILGESAAMGDPEPAFGAGRYLEMLLRERFSGADFEVINVAYTAINSHVILPIARECAEHDGDLWIVYMGNNEMVGPFGAATVFGAQAPPRVFVQFVTAIQKARVGQLLMALARKITGSSTKLKSWGGMQMFLQNQVPPDSPRKEAVYQNFKSNLDDILRAGLGSGAKIVLNTVAVNLKDSPPFASLHAGHLTEEARAQCDSWLPAVRQLEAQGRFDAAAQLCERAVAADARYAEFQYLWGESLLQMTNAAGAREHLQLACDNDALPFRTDSRINAAILDAGRRFDGRNLVLFDAAAALTGESPLNLCGQETFFEHVHFNFDGNYRLGRLWADQVQRLLPDSITQHKTVDWASQQTCERRLGLTDWNRAFVLQSELRRFQQPPLSTQSNNAERLADIQKEEAEFRQHMTLAAAPEARQLYLEAIQHAPDDHLVRENYAAFLESIGDFKEAVAQWRAVRELIPQDFLAFFQLGRMLERLGQREEAKSALAQAVVLRPTVVEAWFELGKIHAAEGQFPRALEEIEHACAMRPQDAVLQTYKGKVLSKLGRRDEAMGLYHRAIELDASYWEAHDALAEELANGGQTAEAASEYATVIRLKPDQTMAHLNLGVMFVKLGRVQEGLAKFEDVLRLEPGNLIAQDYLRRVRAREQRSP